MPCYRVPLENGGFALVRGQLGKHCAECHGIGEYLCDFPVGNGKTCDRPMCRAHAVVVGPNRHVCAQHHAALRAQPFELESPQGKA